MHLICTHQQVVGGLCVRRQQLESSLEMLLRSVEPRRHRRRRRRPRRRWGGAASGAVRATQVLAAVEGAQAVVHVAGGGGLGRVFEARGRLAKQRRRRARVAAVVGGDQRWVVLDEAGVELQRARVLRLRLPSTYRYTL